MLERISTTAAPCAVRVPNIETACGFELNADHNSAKNILKRALKR